MFNEFERVRAKRGPMINSDAAPQDEVKIYSPSRARPVLAAA
jgi:hypothetical protein